jgi:hypothetical protein
VRIDAEGSIEETQALIRAAVDDRIQQWSSGSEYV